MSNNYFKIRAYANAATSVPGVDSCHTKRRHVKHSKNPSVQTYIHHTITFDGTDRESFDRACDELRAVVDRVARYGFTFMQCSVWRRSEIFWPLPELQDSQWVCN